MKKAFFVATSWVMSADTPVYSSEINGEANDDLLHSIRDNSDVFAVDPLNLLGGALTTENKKGAFHE